MQGSQNVYLHNNMFSYACSGHKLKVDVTGSSGGRKYTGLNAREPVAPRLSLRIWLRTWFRAARVVREDTLARLYAEEGAQRLFLACLCSARISAIVEGEHLRRANWSRSRNAVLRWRAAVTVRVAWREPRRSWQWWRYRWSRLDGVRAILHLVLERRTSSMLAAAWLQWRIAARADALQREATAEAVAAVCERRLSISSAIARAQP